MNDERRGVTVVEDDADKNEGTGTVRREHAKQPRQFLEDLAEVGEQRQADRREPNNQQVTEMVEPAGACYFRDRLRVVEGTELSDPLQKLYNDEAFLKDLAFRDPSEEIGRDELAHYLPDADEATVNRVYHLLNHSIDPELIPDNLLDEIGVDPVPSEFTEALSKDAALREQLTAIMVDKTLHETLLYADSFDDPAVQDELTKVTQFIDAYMKHVTTDRAAERKKIEDLLWIHRTDEGGEEPAMVQSALSLLSRGPTDASLGRYFQYADKDLADSQPYTETFAGSFPPKDFLRRRGEAFEAGRYGVDLYNRVEEIYKEYLPEVYVDPSVSAIRVETQGQDDTPNSYAKPKDVGKSTFDPDTDRLGIGTSPLEVMYNQHYDRPSVSTEHGHGKNKVVDSVGLAHEIGHAFFMKRFLGEKGIAQAGMSIADGDNTWHEDNAATAIAEGYSVLLEFRFGDVLTQHPELFDLDQEDVAHIAENKKIRLRSLMEEKSHYTEGTFNIMLRLYREAAGDPEHPDIHAGLGAVTSFVDSMDMEKALAVKRDDPEYLRLLRSGKSDDWRAFFGKAA